MGINKRYWHKVVKPQCDIETEIRVFDPKKLLLLNCNGDTYYI